MQITNIGIAFLCGVVLASCGASDQAGMPQEPPEAPGELRVEVGPLWGHCILHWTPPAGGADGYDVQSTLNGWTYVGFAGATIPGDATQAELDFSSVATELVAIDLKIRARRGTNVSDYSPSGRCAVPLHPIGPLVPAFTSDGMRLIWLGGSMVATGFVIDRAELNTSGAPGPWSQLARAPFPMVRSDGYLDTTVQTGKAYAYRITAVTDDQRSDSAEATTLRLTPGLTSGTQSLPIAQTMAADGKGHFAFASHGFGMLRVIWRNSADWIATDLQSFGSSVDVQLDKSGLPHSVYLKAPASGTGSLITYGWSDGTQWLEETIAQRSLTETSLTGALRFAIDAAGNPVIVWWNLDRVFEGAIKVDGAWQITSFDLVPDDLGYAYGLFSDHSGVAHALFASI